MYDTKKLEDEISRLMMDDDVTNKKGIYAYVLSRNERTLSIRAFTPAQKREAYERQGGICPGWHCECGKHFDFSEMEADHITPWSKGGKTVPDNCQMLCSDCNRRKSGV
jgi:5-methylcytosine-specific restriction endonuclease McrA